MSEATFIYIVGPTATGKTELSLRLAEKLRWPVINFDSVQFYTDVNIGTAKPSVEERQRARHYLFDYVQPPRKMTAADYLRDVESVFEQESLQDALFVGGSGFYVQALEKGLYPEAETPEVVRQQVDQWLLSEGEEVLYHWLQERDPEFAARIHPQDHYRLKRAVGLMKSQNRTMTELKQSLAQQSQSPLPEHRSIKVGLNDERDRLRDRVRTRTERMLAQGFVDEVRLLREQGLQDWAPLQSVGYREVQAHLDGEITREDLPGRIATATMQLIKKQQTWFKRDAEVQWFRPDELEQALEWVVEQALPSS